MEPAGGASCPVTLASYSATDPDRIPRILPCGHTISTRAIAGLEVHANKVQCPLCRETFKYKPADKRPKNFALIENISQLHAQEQPAERPPDSPAPSPPAAPALPAQPTQPTGTLPLCAEHKQPLVLFCETDQQPICLVDAQFGTHKGHNVKDINLVAAEHIATIKKSATGAEGVIKRVKERQGAVAQAVTQLHSNAERTARLIDSEIDSIIKAANSRRQELQDTLKKHIQVLAGGTDLVPTFLYAIVNTDQGSTILIVSFSFSWLF